METYILINKYIIMSKLYRNQNYANSLATIALLRCHTTPIKVK